MYKRKSKNPHEMTDDEAIARLFPKPLVKHVAKEVAPTVKKKSTTEKKV